MDTKKTRVLVADDDRTLADVIRFAFARANFDVTVAYDGKAALQRAQQERFEIVLCDYQMPFLNGEQVLTGIREEGASREAVLILCTAKGYELEAERLQKDLNITEIMPKPFSLVSLIDIARKALANAPVAAC